MVPELCTQTFSFPLSYLPKVPSIHERKEGGGEKRTGKIRGMELKYCRGMAEIASRDTSLFQM